MRFGHCRRWPRLQEEKGAYGLPGVIYFPKSFLATEDINPKAIEPVFYRDTILTLEALQVRTDVTCNSVCATISIRAF